MSKHFFFTDDSITSFFKFQKVSAQKTSIETAANIGLIEVPAAAHSFTLSKGNGQQTFQFTKGFLLNQSIIYSLKVGINNPLSFNHGANACPAGHTSTLHFFNLHDSSTNGMVLNIVFAINAFSGFTTFSNIDAHKHDGKEILEGWVIGWEALRSLEQSISKNTQNLLLIISTIIYSILSTNFKYN
ncbi:hypothetical protein [Gelidibacter salicanalis]|uniref:Uncharacterized protein n=1 Tax=Gelidibacter salicanalis TaxID=291193 RepID=A0A934KNJ6_9FLAO|nr:hypothetical protein [Gelidibacter salicanalis]MBJ7882547.1 hypothetical protein [Gelidibacter salicanalis]